MLSNALPDPFKYGENSSPEIPNAVIYANSASPYHYPKHETPYLFLSNYNNCGHYRLNDQPISVDERVFYFLNAGDQLEINFTKKIPLKTLIILFSRRLMRDVMAYRDLRSKDILSQVHDLTATGPQIPTIPFIYNSSISFCINKIIQDEFENTWDAEYAYFELINELLNVNNKSQAELSKIYVKKKSTREEIYKRMLLARMYIEEHVNLPLTIDEMAKEACLNKFHFLKLFKNYYGITPYQFLLDLKMKRACELLKSGKCSVQDVCFMMGFESQGSFTNLFKKHHGFVPSALFKS